MFKKVKDFYRFLSHRLLTTQRIRKFASFSLLTVGVFSGFLWPKAGVYADARTLDQLSTAQFTLVETTTLASYQFPLKSYYLAQRFSPMHLGIDMDAPAKAPIYPIAEGEVEQINYWSFDYGRHIIINHGNGLESLYAHLSTIEVKKGDKVGKSAILGGVGSTGWSTGNHLHLEIYDKGRPLDPLEVLSERKE